MHKALFPIVMTALVGVASAPSASAQETGGIAWQENLKRAHSDAQASGKLLLLHFYGDNCVWCDRLEAGAFKAPAVGQAINAKYVPVKIHVGKNPSLAKMFKVKSLPTDVLVSTDGSVLSHGVSPQDPTRYVAMLNTAAGSVPLPAQQVAPQSPVVPPSQQQPMLAQNVGPAAAPMAASANLGNPQVAGNNASVQVNQFALPTQGPAPVRNPTAKVATTSPQAPTNTDILGGAIGQTVGVRTDRMTLGEPVGLDTTSPQKIATQSAAKPNLGSPTAAKAKSAATPPLALEGYCAVTINEAYQWVEGKPEFGVIHLGRLYLFSSQENLNTFVADPDPYTPVMNEIDVVRFFEERVIVPGKRDYGVKDPVHGRMFFFADQAARDHFENQFERYTDAAIEVMQRAVRDANPTM